MATITERKASVEVVSKTPMFILSRIPLIPKQFRNKMLSNFTQGLSKEAFDISVPYIIEAVVLDRKTSQKYKGAWQETYAILQGFPRLQEQKYRYMIYERVKDHREKNSLAV